MYYLIGQFEIFSFNENISGSQHRTEEKEEQVYSSLEIFENNLTLYF